MSYSLISNSSYISNFHSNKNINLADYNFTLDNQDYKTYKLINNNNNNNKEYINCCNNKYKIDKCTDNNNNYKIDDTINDINQVFDNTKNKYIYTIPSKMCNNNILGSCRSYNNNRGCVDHVSKQFCDKYNMLWSNTTCNSKIDVKPLTVCPSDFIYNKVDNNCIKCPKKYTFIQNKCIKNPYYVNKYQDSGKTTNDLLNICNKENNNNCELYINKGSYTKDGIFVKSESSVNIVKVKCNNDSFPSNEYMCNYKDIKPEIQSITNSCPKNYIFYKNNCFKVYF
jgi:hypothetical protein